jgi:hypothetical protein
MIMPAQVPNTGVPDCASSLAHVGAEVAQHPAVRLEVALQREDADYHPRLASS